ncbi:MAG: DUF4286 family protein [Xanthomonadales bacterium]|nr:DUF4286 family protein [Xanthomonadales bacterium]
MNDTAIEYEVTLEVDDGIADDFLAWLRGHVAEMLALSGFTSATLLSLDMESADHRGFCVRYHLHDRDALDAYLHDHAPRMREDGLRRFGDAFRASRRILVSLED